MYNYKRIPPPILPVYPLDSYPVLAHPVQYNEHSSIMGKVVRVQPNIYIFACDYCPSEFRSIDSFLRHSEAHFAMQTCGQYDQPNMIPPAHNFQSAFTSSSVMQSASRSSPMTIIPPNPPLPQSFQPVGPAQSRIGTPNESTSNSSHDLDDYFEEIYEITDLGYDNDGKYSTVQNAVVHPNNGQTKTRRKRKRTEEIVEQNFDCSFCDEKFTQSDTFKRHKIEKHSNILKELIEMKMSYKCFVCHTKFPKSQYSLMDAENHMTKHFDRSKKGSV